MHKLKVLICDDQDHIRVAHESLILRCAKGIFHPEIIEAASGEEAVQLVSEAQGDGSRIDLVLMDIDFGQDPGENCLSGFQAADQIHRIFPDVVIVMVSSISTQDNHHLSASTPYIERFFTRGQFDPTELTELCKYALVRTLNAKNLLLPPDKVAFTQSAVMNQYLAQIDRFPENESVFISGETGTGKGLSAFRLNANAKAVTNNPSRVLATVNCASLAPTLLTREIFGHVRGAFTGAERDQAGWLEKADGGDLFLDELQNASPEFQQVLLVFLQTGEFTRLGETKTTKVNVRVIAAFNEDPVEAIRSGKLREDLFARLQKNYVRIPALRERKDDIAALVTHFQRLYSKADKTFSRDAVEFLESLPWSTNVRGVKGAVEAAIRDSKVPVITALTLQNIPFIQEILREMKMSGLGAVTTTSVASSAALWETQALELFDIALGSGKSLHEIMISFERVVLERSMRQDPAVLRVAKRLRIPESSLRKKLEKHELPSCKATAKRLKSSEIA